MIVRFGLDQLALLRAELGLERPLLVTTPRFASLELPVARRFSGVQRHAPLDTVEEAEAAAAGADSLVGLGGGSAIDTAKAVSARRGLPLVCVPTTYAGAEWTSCFGMRDERQRLKTGGSGARTVAIVYEPELTVTLSREESGGPAMNALAHCVEALYLGDLEQARRGQAGIRRFLPLVLEDGDDRRARRGLLEAARYFGEALSLRGLYLGHAMAQALGGRYGFRTAPSTRSACLWPCASTPR